MSRSLSQPYRASNPRSVRGARRRGWYVVDRPRHGGAGVDVSWIGLNIWCEQHCTGYWVSSFGSNNFAFESGPDATLFKLKWA